jgi:hypothetical protein
MFGTGSQTKSGKTARISIDDSQYHVCGPDTSFAKNQPLNTQGLGRCGMVQRVVAYHRQLTPLRRQLADPTTRRQPAHQQLGQAMAIDSDKQAELATIAQALGLSVAATHSPGHLLGSADAVGVDAGSPRNLGARLAADRDWPQWAQAFRQLPAGEQLNAQDPLPAAGGNRTAGGWWHLLKMTPEQLAINSPR